MPKISQKPSKIAPVENPPMFIVVGSDDNTNPEAIKWMQNVIDSGVNFDGSKRYMSFYVNTGQPCAPWSEGSAISTAAVNAYRAGHEVTNHTEDHLFCINPEGKWTEQEVIEQRILSAQNALIKAGIPKEHHFGFRTPYLAYSDLTFNAVEKIMKPNGAQFLYDCSINAEDNKNGSNFPYTLDSTPDENGNVAPDNNDKLNDWGKNNPVREHKGIWELPAHKIDIADKDISYVESILKSKYGSDFSWDGKIVGLDYNMWNEAELNAEQTTRAYINTLQKNLATNRAPLTIGVHSQFYFEERADLYPNVPTPQEKQKSFVDFVEQASKIKGVFFVSGDMVIRWMLNPVSADKFRPENYRRT